MADSGMAIGSRNTIGIFGDQLAGIREADPGTGPRAQRR